MIFLDICLRLSTITRENLKALQQFILALFPAYDRLPSLSINKIINTSIKSNLNDYYVIHTHTNPHIFMCFLINSLVFHSMLPWPYTFKIQTKYKKQKKNLKFKKKKIKNINSNTKIIFQLLPWDLAS